MSLFCPTYGHFLIETLDIVMTKGSLKKTVFFKGQATKALPSPTPSSLVATKALFFMKVSLSKPLSYQLMK